MEYFISKFDSGYSEIRQQIRWQMTSNNQEQDTFFPMSSMYINLKWNRIEHFRHKYLDISLTRYFMKLLQIQTSFNSYSGSFLSLLNPPCIPFPTFSFLPKPYWQMRDFYNLYNEVRMTSNCRDIIDCGH